ncbi:hypothetical protein Tco_0908766 [Tanacetum coccineum]|uniref:Uncharacterized protein n=1 Tax=Tanacetum coccineum TaxID=301880 RepID=A0ABQ5CN29_9ASTR
MTKRGRRRYKDDWQLVDPWCQRRLPKRHEEAPSKIEELQPLAARTTLPSSDHTPTLSDPTPTSPLTDEEIKVLEPSDTRITSSHSTDLLDSTTPLSPDHPLTQTTPIPRVFRPLYYRRTARMAMCM